MEQTKGCNVICLQTSEADHTFVGEMTSPRFGDCEDVGILNGTLTPIFFVPAGPTLSGHTSMACQKMGWG